MDRTLDPGWYREEAKRLREGAAALANDDQLRDRYLRLALEYDKLADLLENRARR